MIEPYRLPHECESAEIAELLALLTPRQRRVLRAYVWQVELGERTVGAWLADEKCPVARSTWYERDTEKARYWWCEAFQLALTAYRRAGLAWQTDQEKRSIAQAQRKIRATASGAADRLSEQVQGDLSVFFKTVERWTEHPLPSQEVLEDKVETVEKDGKPVQVFFYLVRQTVLDLEKLRESRYARLVKKFSDSPRGGLSIEIYDAQRASESVLDRADLETASKSTPGGGVIVVIPDNGRADRPPGRAANEIPGESG